MLYDPEYGVGRYGGRDPRLGPASRSIVAPWQQYGFRPSPEAYGRVSRYGRPVSPEYRGFPEFPVVYIGSVPMRCGQYHQDSEPSMEDVAQVVEHVQNRTDALRREGTRMKTYFLIVGIDRVGFQSAETRDLQQIPINRIHFVAADPRCPNVFSLVARGRGNRFFCHVFECSNHWQCDSITKTVSLAFRLAYEKWMRVEENQRRVEERRAREMDMGGLEYFQEWDDHAPRGMPLYNISSYYNSGSSRPRQYLRPHDEMPRLPDRLIVSRGNNREPESEPYSVRFTFDEDDYDDSPQEEVYVRQEAGGRRGRQQPVVYDIRPDWE
ncbi:uncharacterized protein LOC110980984 isoform X2 [Acanthaster planci]|uniref:Uncharacterized protein LOC110980984 isoform X2 n=1 Tax=Acanthaster planci TaxID=133434 RepID=A0A8B7YKK3_ACAPL|nr:uncharacterized protein LOC110980984 isoform X2 [Acanthaster planci]